MPPTGQQSAQGTVPAPDIHALFTQWCLDHGVEINGVKPSSIPGRGIGLIATTKIAKGQKILFIPNKAMLRPPRSLLSKYAIMEHGLPKASSLAILTAHVMAECQKPDSAYSAWQATWPSASELRSRMPLFWPPQLRARLPPYAEALVDGRMAYVTEDREMVLEMMTGELSRSAEQKERAISTSAEDFEYFWTIVNTRCLYFQPPGSGRPYLVLCPFADYINHGPSGTGVSVKQVSRGYEVVADRDYAHLNTLEFQPGLSLDQESSKSDAITEPNEEILATYSAYANDKLLVEYGFITSYNPGEATDDDICLDQLIVPCFSDDLYDSLRGVGFLGGYGLLPAKNELCFKTQVAVRAILFRRREWAYYAMNGEDRNGDQSDKVRAWIVPKLKEYREKARQMVDEDGPDDVRPAGNGGPDPEVARSLLRQRWTQIVVAIDAFLGAEPE